MTRAALLLVVLIGGCEREPRRALPAPPPVAAPNPDAAPNFDAAPNPDAAPSILGKMGGAFASQGPEQDMAHLFEPTCIRGHQQPPPTLPFPVSIPPGISVFASWCLDGDTLFHGRGTKAGEGKLVGGRPDGAWTYYYESGERLLAGRYINGEADGLWRAYDPDGTVTQLGCFRAGRKRWSVTGDKMAEGC